MHVFPELTVRTIPYFLSLDHVFYHLKAHVNVVIVLPISNLYSPCATPPPGYKQKLLQLSLHHERKSGVTEAWWGLLEPLLFFLASRASPPPRG